MSKNEKNVIKGYKYLKVVEVIFEERFFFLINRKKGENLTIECNEIRKGEFFFSFISGSEI